MKRYSISELREHFGEQINLSGRLKTTNISSKAVYVLEIVENDKVGMIPLSGELLKYLENTNPADNVEIQGELKEAENDLCIAELRNINELKMPLNQLYRCDFINGIYQLSSGPLRDLDIYKSKTEIEDIEKIRFFRNRYEFVSRISKMEERIFKQDFVSDLPKDCLVRVIGFIEYFYATSSKRNQFQLFSDEADALMILIEDDTFNCIMQSIGPYYPDGYLGFRGELAGKLDMVNYEDKTYLALREIERGIIDQYEFVKD